MSREYLNKEYKIELENNKNIKCLFGSVNKKQPDVVYLKLKTYITPSEDKGDKSEYYLEDLKILKYNIKKKISEEAKYLCGDILDIENGLFNFDLKERALCYGKKLYFNADFFFKQKDITNMINIDDENLFDKMNGILNNSLNSIKSEFNFSLKK